MAKKQYVGLEVEFIYFGNSEMGTITPVPDSGCTVGAVTYFTSDDAGKPMQYGQCWYADPYEDLSFDWQHQGGSIMP